MLIDLNDPILGLNNFEDIFIGESDYSMLMGDDVPPRREFIEANAKYANIDA